MAHDGGYSKTPTVKDLDELINVSKPLAGQYSFQQFKRPPGTCILWSEKRNDFTKFIEDENIVRRMWGKIELQGYSFCWTNLTW